MWLCRPSWCLSSCIRPRLEEFLPCLPHLLTSKDFLEDLVSNLHFRRSTSYCSFRLWLDETALSLGIQLLSVLTLSPPLIFFGSISTTHGDYPTDVWLLSSSSQMLLGHRRLLLLCLYWSSWESAKCWHANIWSGSWLPLRVLLPHLVFFWSLFGALYPSLHDRWSSLHCEILVVFSVSLCLIIFSPDLVWISSRRRSARQDSGLTRFHLFLEWFLIQTLI